MRLLTAALGLLATTAITARAFGQDNPATDVAIDLAPPVSLDVVTFLGSGPGVIALTLAFVQMIKAGFAQVPGLKNVPNSVYAVLVACCLTYLANQIFQTLEGNLGQLLWQAALNAMAASGAYSWFHKPGASPETASAPKISSRSYVMFLALIPALFLGGCAATPTKQWAQAREALTTAQNILVMQADAGELSDEEIVAADTAVQAARAALEQAETYLPEGGKSFVSYMEIVRSVLNKLAELQTPKEKHTNAIRSDPVDDWTRHGSREWAYRPSSASGGQRRNHARTVGRDQDASWRQRRCLGPACRSGPRAFGQRRVMA